MVTARTASPSTVARTWLERIESGAFTASQARQWAAAVVPIAEGRPARGFRTTLSRDEAAQLRFALLVNGPVGVDPFSTAKGRRWLSSREARRLGVPSPDLFSRFEFDGSTDGYRPVWRVVLTDGREFEYVAVPWQAMAYGGDEMDYSWWRWIAGECAHCGQQIQPIEGGDPLPYGYTFATVAENDPACPGRPSGHLL